MPCADTHASTILLTGKHLAYSLHLDHLSSSLLIMPRKLALCLQPGRDKGIRIATMTDSDTAHVATSK